MTDIKVLKNKKGFTLIELIVVMAILAILAAIAIPKFSAMRVASAVNADASTAAQIANACRVQETQTGDLVTSLDPTAAGGLKATYMVVPAIQTLAGTTAGTTFSLSAATVAASKYGAITGGGGVNPYIVSFTPSSSFGPYNVAQNVIEHVKFLIEP